MRDMPSPSAADGSRRERNPPGQGGRLRTDIVQAADRLLAQTGDVSAISLRAIAREAGVAAPSIYLHFPNKQAIVGAVRRARFEDLAAALRSAVVRGDDPVRQLRAGCEAYCRFAVEHPNAYRVLFGDLRRSPASPPASTGNVTPVATSGSPARTLPDQDPGRDAFTFLTDGIQRCIDIGAAPPADPFHTATNLWTALHGIVTLRASAPGFAWPPLLDQIDDMLRGLVGLKRS